MQLRKHLHAFTLVEILIASVLFLGMFAAFGLVMRGVAVKVSDQERKAATLNLTAGVLDKYLTWSYEEMETEGQNWSKTHSGCTVQADRQIMAAGAGRDAVPYYLVQVSCPYTEAGGAAGQMTLTGVIPYPHIRVLSQHSTSVMTASSIETLLFRVPVNVQVRSSLLIFYNLAITPSGGAIQPADLLYTRARVYPDTTAPNATHWVGVETGTPLLTQPTVNNVVRANVSKGTSQVEIHWRHDSAAGSTVVNLRKVAVNILVVERNF